MSNISLKTFKLYAFRYCPEQDGDEDADHDDMITRLATGNGEAYIPRIKGRTLAEVVAIAESKSRDCPCAELAIADENDVAQERVWGKGCYHKTPAMIVCAYCGFDLNVEGRHTATGKVEC